MSSEKIIVPLDVPNLEAAIALVETLPEVGFWKVGLELFVATGQDILTYLKDRQKKIFLDLKFHDIPNTVAGACRSAKAYDVDLLTVHSTAGRVALTAAKEAIADSATKIIAISLLTSISPRELAIDLQVPLELPEYALNMATMVQECGLDGAVCSPHEAAQLRSVCGPNFLLVCPGVRPTWAQKGDQQRVMTPKQALAAGASYLVIGRPITAAPDPVAAWEKIVAEVSD